MMQLLLRAHFSFCQSSPGLSLHPPTMISLSLSLSLSCCSDVREGSHGVAVASSLSCTRPAGSTPTSRRPRTMGRVGEVVHRWTRILERASPKVEGKGRFASPRGKETPRA
ncbi:hypothetical protein ACP70R_000946 [Stipagrostis hirtigluma subsp. patula]